MAASQAKTNLDRLPEGFRLSSRALTALLVLMCIIPVATVLGLHFSMPLTQEGKLEASIGLAGHPGAGYYKQEIYERKFIPSAAIVLKNEGQDEWRLVNIRLNGKYQIIDPYVTIKPGAEKRYLLSKFTSKEGALFELRAHPVKKVVVFAKLPSNQRCSKTKEFTHE